MKVRQYNDQKKNNRTNDDLQNTNSKLYIEKSKDGAIRTPLKTTGERRCSGSGSSSYSTNDTHRITEDTKGVTISRKLNKDR